jgi:uncharacterized delta-60 repeat protein
LHNGAGGGNNNDFAAAMILDASGKILVTGRSTNSSGIYWDSALWRFNADGTPDTTLGGTGFVTHGNAAGGGLHDKGNAITIDQTGNILIAGVSNNGTDYDLVVTRYTSAGVLDTTFDSNGFCVFSNIAGTFDETAHGIAVDSNNKILVAGSSLSNTGEVLILLRLDSNGALDTTFNSTGTTPGIATYQTTATSTERAYAMTIDSIGRILITGFSAEAGQADVAVWRFLNSGLLDINFASTGSSPGKVKISISSTASYADFGYGITLDSSNRILVNGFSESSTTSYDMFLLRLSAEGELDLTFNSGGAKPGVVTWHNAAGGDLYDHSYDIAVNSDNKIIVTGSSMNANGNFDMALWCVNL